MKKFDIQQVPFKGEDGNADPKFHEKTQKLVDDGYELYDLSGRSAKYRKRVEVSEGADQTRAVQEVLARKLGVAATDDEAIKRTHEFAEAATAVKATHKGKASKK